MEGEKLQEVGEKRGNHMTLQQLKYAILVAESKSMSEAARKSFISQPAFSQAIQELEEETGTEIFRRTNRGIQITPEGEEFIGYARLVADQYELLEAKYVRREKTRKKFSVSMQHYTFAVQAFVNMVKTFGVDEYEFAIYETKTYDVIQNVKNFRSEVGILFQNEFNRKYLEKLFRNYELEFHELLNCQVYVYMWNRHPLAKRMSLKLEELEEFPCLAFSQGNQGSLLLSEEVMSNYDYKQVIKVEDRATMLNLMKGLNGYTLCSGIVCEELNGSEYCAVRLETDENMTIGYLKRRDVPLSRMGKLYIEEIKQYLQSE